MNRFPAKLLLFGEYSILLGSSALGVPFTAFSAALAFPGKESREPVQMMTESNRLLKLICDYFMADLPSFSGFLDVIKFSEDISNGLYLDSAIPQRYGLGSSGALCAAVFERYKVQDFMPDGHSVTEVPDLLKLSLAKMESFFHGRSSGFDPLVSLVKKPLHVRAGGQIVIVPSRDSSPGATDITVLLADSGQPCSTGPLVKGFLDEYSPGGASAAQGQVLCSLVNECVDRYMANDTDAFWQEINRLSLFQIENFTRLVPESFRPVWAHGLQSGLFAMKLCGSGGGGFLLCFTQNPESTREYFNRLGITVTALPPPLH